MIVPWADAETAIVLDTEMTETKASALSRMRIDGFETNLIARPLLIDDGLSLDYMVARRPVRFHQGSEGAAPRRFRTLVESR